MRFFLSLFWAVFLSLPAAASTIPAGPVNIGTFSFVIGAGERCEYDLHDTGDFLGCTAVSDREVFSIPIVHIPVVQTAQQTRSISPALSRSSTPVDAAWIEGDRLRFMYWGSTMSYNLMTGRGGGSTEHGPGGGQLELSFNGDKGTHTFYDDDIPFAVVTREISNVQATLDIGDVPLPPGLALGLSGLAALSLAGWVGRRQKARAIIPYIETDIVM